MKIPTTYLLAGGIAASALAFFYLYGRSKNDGGGGFFQDIGVGAGNAAIDLIDGVVAGGATAIGDKFGIPRTNMTECQKALAEGRTWDASLACPAGTFINGAVSGGVTAIGDKLGIPRTNKTECEKALAEGRTWDASFACPATTFIGSFF